jgi:hypothetical protein
MVKKRPRALHTPASACSRTLSKNEPKYWRDRLFRNTFTYRGKTHEVGHWSVKIQHLGTRKTFSLEAIDRQHAALEASKLYKTIVTRGWETVLSANKSNGANLRPLSDAIASRKGYLGISYWGQRLIHRKYTEALHRPLLPCGNG